MGEGKLTVDLGKNNEVAVVQKGVVKEEFSN